MGDARLRCTRCGRTYPVDERRVQCICGGPLQVSAQRIFPRRAIAGRPPSLWRYREAIALPAESPIVSFGEGMTPLVPGRWANLDVYLKLDYLFPTGSFKDRGSAVVASWLSGQGIQHVVEDSSGNAGVSLAGYCARAGIRCDVYAPATAARAKLVQIRAHGARLVAVPGSRDDTTRAVEAAARETFYASHNRLAFFLEGARTWAFEVWEQLGWQAPDAVVVPAGAGSVVLGAAIGFGDLLGAGEVDRLPRIYGIQSEGCMPMAQAYTQGLVEAAPVEQRETAAEGIRIARPFRDRELLAAVRASGGAFLAVPEDEIWSAVAGLAAGGFFVEPTSAVAAAGLSRLAAAGAVQPGERVVLFLSGSGLKAADRIAAKLGDVVS
ncbi:MAG: threonine synthase [Chloroflexi bacterium]|nr:threonine synthase [Chloroflexota bacterium]